MANCDSVIKKYYINFNNTDIIGYTPQSLELFIFPEDITSSLETKYNKLNTYGVYPYSNLRIHNINVRYGNRFLLKKLEGIALESLESGIPITFGTAYDYAAVESTATAIPDPAITTTGNETTDELIQLEINKTLERLAYEEILENNLELFSGFIELPLQFTGLIKEGDSINGFNLRIVEVKDYFRNIRIEDLSFKLPPENYSSFEESIVSSEISYASGGGIVVKPGYVRKGFSITLPTCYTDVLENLKYYKTNGLFLDTENPGLEILDNIGNSFNGKGVITSLSTRGAVNRNVTDSNLNNLIPEGVSFSVVSLEPFITS